MQLVDVLRVLVFVIIVAFPLVIAYRDLSFSFSSPKRRYRYERKCSDEPNFEVRGSGFFSHPSVRSVAMLPRYAEEPIRRVVDSKTGAVLYHNKKD